MNTPGTTIIRDTDIAIIGMACRFPGATNVDEFWTNLANGVESITFFTDQQLAPNTPAAQDPAYVKAAGILPEIENFDAGFFGYTSREAELLDPQQRLLLECAWESLENAGYDPESNQHLIGVYAGAGMNTYLINNVHPNRGFAPNRTFLESVNDLQVMLSNDKDYLPTRISYKLNLKGPSINVQTACSTSLVAVHLACQGLLNGECDMALAGSAFLRVPQYTGHLYQPDMIFSSDGHCRAFDQQADGTVFSNGAGMVVLKLLRDALDDGDSIHAVIKGSAINNDGAQKVSYNAPSVDGQARVIAEAQAVAGVDPRTITYVETHGTATALGDLIEIEALSQAFFSGMAAWDAANGEGDAAEQGGVENHTGYCAIGSVKTNLGHLGHAAGMAGLLKCILALKHRQLPPSLHFTEPNPKIDFAHSPFYVNHQLTDWSSVVAHPDLPLRAGVSAFGMGGTNAHVVLEEWRQEDKETRRQGDRETGCNTQLLTLSARSEEALSALVTRYAAYLAVHPDLDLGDVCYTANGGRHHFPRRRAFVADSLAELQTQLQTYSQQRHDAGQLQPSLAPRKVAFLFTGQGSQYVDMGRTLYETEPTFRATLDRCEEIWQECQGRSLLDLLYPVGEPEDNDLLESHVCGQAANFALECALADMWRSWGIEPDVVLGHSLGDFAAAYTAGVLGLEEGLRLVTVRGTLMATAHGNMLSVLATEAEVLPFLADYDDVTIGVINGPRSVVVSGGCESMARVAEALQEAGFKTRVVDVPMAAHSPMLDPVLDDFEAAVRQVSLHEPNLTVISSMTGQPVSTELIDPGYWRAHLRNTVRFGDGVTTLLAQGVGIMLELGPKATLLGLAEQCFDAMPAPFTRPLMLPSLHNKRADWRQVLESLGKLYEQGCEIDWLRVKEEAGRHKVILPTYPFQRRRYWIEAATSEQTGQTALNQHHGAGFSAPSSAGIHPLLHQRLSLAGTQDLHFETEINPTALEWVSDHCVFGTTVLPGTAFAEIALAAGAAVFPKTPFCLQNLRIQRALTFPANAPQITQVVVKRVAEEQRNGADASEQIYLVQLYSLAPTSGEPQASPTWQLHATGQLVAAKTEQTAIDLALLQTLCQSPVSVDALYGRFEAQGIHYGDSYRTMQRVWREDDLALGRIELTPALGRELARYQLHPALLDACTQVLEALADADDPTMKTYVPIGLERLAVYGCPSAQVWSAVQLRPASVEQPSLMSADFHVFNEDGTLLAALEGFQLKEASQETMLGKTAENRQEWLYGVEWRPQALPDPLLSEAYLLAPPGLPMRSKEDWPFSAIDTHRQAMLPTPAEIQPNGHATPSNDLDWLILADQNGVGAALQNQLAAAGQRCILVFRGDGFAQRAANECTINPHAVEDIHGLLATVTSAVRGIVHLWSLDAPAVTAQGDSSSAAVMAGVQLGSESTLYLLQALIARGGQPPAVWLITSGAQAIVDGDALSGIVQAPVWGMRKVVALEYPDVQLACLDLDPAELDQGPAQLAAELSLPLAEEQIAYRQGRRYVARLARYEQAALESQLALPEGESFRLELAAQGLMENLTLQSHPRCRPGAGEIEIEVVAAGLNFRDVLYVLDLNPLDLPLGAECAGKVSAIGAGVTQFAVGDPVIAYAFGSLGRHVIVDARLAAPKPANLSYAAAATIPAAFLTAYHAFQSTNLVAGERVLIHAATGGVGQAAIQLARHIGAEVLGTASPGKWPVLRQLGVSQPMNSRTPDFAQEVMAQTAGQGVNVVLNSLTGEGFIAQSLATLAPQGRFLELSKRETWTTAQMQAARPDVTYAILDIAELSQREPARIQQMLRELVAMFEAEILKPLPQTVYPIQQAITAFRTMQQAKHTGKIVLTLPHADASSSQLTFSREATYLITGGFGGLGLRIARWMVEHGAHHLVLVGRQGAIPAVQPALDTLQALGAHVRAVKADVTNLAQVTTVLDEIAHNGPPLRGVIHAVGVLDDGVLHQLDWSRFASVLAPKVIGGWHLHQLTQSYELDFFVLFSSLTALIGNAGQANHAAANTFLDALAYHRQACGLPALSINWGAWTEIGAAAHRQVADHLQARGIGGISPEAGLQVLEQLLQVRAPQVGVSPIVWPRFLAEQMGMSGFFADFVGAGQAAARQNGEPSFQTQWATALPTARANLLIEHVRMQVAKVLGQQEAANLSRTTGFFDLGMDSLTSIELRNRLQASLGFPLPATLAFDYPTLETLVSFLKQKLEQLALQASSAQAMGWNGNGHGATSASYLGAQQPTDETEAPLVDSGSDKAPDTMIDEIARRLAAQLGD